ncbi:MAG: hypothetical protein M3186_08035 [Actinomycetota bacterium]|nr:hypothetical protein [Actinomycetota bacterium]
MKLQGLCAVAETYGSESHRIEAVSKIGASMRILDLQTPQVCEAILKSKVPPRELYEADFAIEYDL